ncbi:unnamed protein product, partial [marine sediment metagenome]
YRERDRGFNQDDKRYDWSSRAVPGICRAYVEQVGG